MKCTLPAITALALLVSGSLFAAGSTPPRNVLFLISDDLNNFLGCYGDPRAKTPNLDRLAARGVRFDRAYCTFPLCGPSRNSMLTGLYPNSSGILANAQIFRQTIPQHVSLPQAFRRQGYFAARLGKLIVFTSDHGYHMGEHGLWQKMSLFEESTRVPLFIVAPGVTVNGGVAPTPVSQVDLYPTLTALCGVPAPANLQGQNLVPILKDPSQPGRGWALTQVTRGGKQQRFFGYSLRTPRWRYTEWDQGQQGRELYDHGADPRELTNLADKPEQQQTVAELSEKLRAAVRESFPASGETPPVVEGLWAPMLVK